VKSKTAWEKGDEGGPSRNHLLLGTRSLKELVTPLPWTNEFVWLILFCFCWCCFGVETNRFWELLALPGVQQSTSQLIIFEIDFSQQGHQKGLLMKDGPTGSSLMVFVWIDCDCQYSISRVSSLDASSPTVQYCWRQIQQLPNADPERMEIEGIFFTSQGTTILEKIAYVKMISWLARHVVLRVTVAASLDAYTCHFALPSQMILRY